MDTIKIGPFVWTIEQPTLGGKELNNGEYLGSYTEAELTIRIASDMPDSVREQVLWHEIVHIIANQRNLSLKEGEINGIAYGIVELLNDNNISIHLLTPKP